MHCHPNAVLTPRGRARVFEAVEAGMTVSAACLGCRRQPPLLLPLAAALAGRAPMAASSTRSSAPRSQPAAARRSSRRPS